MKKLVLLYVFIVFGTAAYAQDGVSSQGYFYKELGDFLCEEGVLFSRNTHYNTSYRYNTLIKYPQNKQSTSYTIPAWVYNIAKGAFKGNKYIKTIRIPSSVYYIGENAFDDCEQLTSIEIYEATSSASAIEADSPHSEAKEVGRYNIQGVKVQEDEEGQVQIILYSDGTSQKVINK